MPHLLLHIAQATSTTTKSSKSSGSALPLLVIVVVFAVAYFLFIRPRQQRARQQQTTSRQIGVGDEVMSAGGILGRVVGVDGDEIRVEVAPGVVMTFLRRAISARPASAGGATTSSDDDPDPTDEPWDRGTSDRSPEPNGRDGRHEEPPPGSGEERP